MKVRAPVLITVFLIIAAVLAAGVLYRQRSSEELPARTLRFPEDRSIGIVRMTDWGSPGAWEEAGAARGEVSIPAGKWAWLILSNGKAGDVTALDLLRPDDLQMLMCMDTPITDRGVKSIKRLSSLRSISLKPRNISPEGLAELQEALPDCDFLFEREELTPTPTPPESVN